MHTSHDHTLREIVWHRERKHPVKDIQGLLICIRPVCMFGTMRYYTVALQSWAVDVWLDSQSIESPIDSRC